MVVLPLPGGPKRKIDLPLLNAGPTCASVSFGITRCENARSSSSWVTWTFAIVCALTLAMYIDSGTGARPTY